MSSEFLSDREQEEALRSWWKENWTWVASGVAVGFALLAGWNYWERRSEQQAEAAAQTYRDLTQALANNDKDKVDATIKSLDGDYKGTPYTDQAHLLIAQSHVNGGRFEMAATELKSVVENSDDTALAQVAKLRLARVYIQLGRMDDALALLDVAKAGAFAAQVNELRGDALVAKGDSVGARGAYEAALAAAQAADPRTRGANEYLELKLQELGSAGPPPASPPVSGDAATPSTPPAKQ